MARLRTVLGDVELSPEDAILPHEHLLCDFSPVSGQLNHVLNEPELACAELAALDGTPVAAVIEVTPRDLGRSPGGLVGIAERTGLGVVMATGWYRGAFYPPEIDRRPVADLAAEMVHELEEGVPLDSGDRVRAGVIGELGTEREYISAQEERVFRAAARAAMVTGAPVTTHTGVHPTGVAQCELLLEEGVAPEQIVVGHADMHLDSDYHRRLLELGAYVQFDTTGRLHLNSDERRADYLVELIRSGWAERVMISSDRCFKSDLQAFGGAGYAHSITAFAELLRIRGVTDEEIGLVTRANPQRVFCWA